MKKTLKLFSFLLVFLLISVFAFTVSANDDITVVVDGVKLNFDVPPTVVSGRTLVPVRSIFEALGATIEWDADTSTATAVKGETTVKITVGESQMYVNGSAKELDAGARIIQGRTLIPLRAVSEAFDCKVIWESSINTAIILSDGDNYTVLYDIDGNVGTFKNDEVEAQLTVGWYREPSKLLYTADGQTRVFPISKVAAQLTVGWYENRSDVFFPLYAPDGRVIEKTRGEIEEYKALGWYEEPTPLEIEHSQNESEFNWKYGSGHIFIYPNSVLNGGNVSYTVSPPWIDYKESIRTVYIAYGIGSVGSFVFDEHQGVSRVELSPTVTTIENYAFDNTKITRIGIPKSVTNFNAYAFDTYGLASHSENANLNMVVYCEPDSYAETFAKNVGLKYVYATPVYYPDGRSIMATAAEKEVYLKYGWYEEPVTTMYSADGRTLVCPIANVEANEKVGWYSYKYDVYTTMYSLDGRTLDVLNTEIPVYQGVGWYLFEDYVCSYADQLITTNGYGYAATYLETVLVILQYSDTEKYDIQKVSDKLFAVLADWSDHIDSPIAITGSEITYLYGYPVANFTVRNLTKNTVVAFDTNFTCYNSYGQKTYDAGGSSLIKATASNTVLEPGEEATYSLTLYSNIETSYINDIHVTFVAYSDGSQWFE